MTRTTLIIGALIFALAAAGVLVWTNVIDISKQTAPTSEQPTITQSTPVSETNWAEKMTELAAPEGMAFSFADANLATWSVTDAHRIERFSFGANSQVLARLSSTLPLDPENRLSGLQLKLPLEWAQRVNGKKIEIGVVARQPQTNAANDISLLYATLQAGNSGWQTLKVSTEFQVLKFTFDIPPVETGYTSQPVIVVRSDAAGGDRAVELVGVYVKPLS
jgi:hypothetical protein